MIEKTDLTLGIVPLTDCAPIAVGVERGFFERHGLYVTTSREGSWASIRDKVAFGVLDGAQMIAPMTLATSLGIGGVRCDLVTGINLDLNGNAITVDADLFDQMCSIDPACAEAPFATAQSLKQIIRARSERGLPKMRFGIVFPISTHNYEVRYWLASAGIDPDEDVELVVVPPPQMVDALRSGHIAGFCVGEPWNTVAVESGVGRVVMTKYDLWNNSPEKVLAVTRSWHEENPQTHLALITALIESCQWIDEPNNRAEVCEVLSLPQYVGVEPGLLRPSMTGLFRAGDGERERLIPDFNVFHRYAANFPWRSHALWFLSQMRRWGQCADGIDSAKLADAVYMPEFYREAACRLGVPCPTTDLKSEGVHGERWSIPSSTSDSLELGPDLYFDGMRFSPEDENRYLEDLSRAQDAPLASEKPTDLRL